MSGESLSTALWKDFEWQERVDFFFEICQKDGRTETIGVHSLVLIFKSSVFRAMLTGKLKETSPVRLPDTTPAAFRIFLR